HCFAAAVHISLRFGKQEGVPTPAHMRRLGVALALVARNGKPACHFVYDAKTQVVASSFVASAGVAQPNDQFQCRLFPYSSSESSVVSASPSAAASASASTS